MFSTRCRLLSSLSPDEHERAFELFPSSWRESLTHLAQPLPNVSFWLSSAESKGAMIGCALARQFAWSDQAKLFGLFAAEDDQKASIGTALLQSLEERLIRAHTKALFVEFSDEFPDLSFFEDCLNQCAWSSRYLLLTRYDFVSAEFSAPWLGHLGSFSTKELIEFPWNELMPEERIVLERKIRQGEIPQHLSPFEREEILDPLFSRGLRFADEVVGWLIIHRKNADTLQYTTLYTDRRWQRRGDGLRLLDHALSQQIANGIAYAFFEVYTSRVPKEWRHFVQKRLAPWAKKTTSVYRRWKSIDISTALY